MRSVKGTKLDWLKAIFNYFRGKKSLWVILRCRQQLKKENVVGFKIDHDSEFIEFYVCKKRPLNRLKKKNILPKDIGNYDVTWVTERKMPSADLFMVSTKKPLSKKAQAKAANTYRTKVRPIQPGLSIGESYSKNAGTFGFVAEFEQVLTKEGNKVSEKVQNFLGKKNKFMELARKTGAISSNKVLVGVTNKHVVDRAAVLQPGNLDWNDNWGDFDINTVGHVIFSSDFNEKDPLDVSLFTLQVDYKTYPINLRETVGKEIGTVGDGDRVKKSGRTSFTNDALVYDVGLTMNVNMGDKVVTFHDLIEISGGHFLQPGDSGSAIFNSENQLPLSPA
jgi:hypothetical protein